MADTADAQTTDGNSTIGVQSLKDNVVKFANDAGDKAKGLAEDGKSRAGDALDDLARMLHDAAATVDEKVGDQYGHYARSAADAVGNFSQSIQAKRLVKAGLDAPATGGTSTPRGERPAASSTETA